MAGSPAVCSKGCSDKLAGCGGKPRNDGSGGTNGGSSVGVFAWNAADIFPKA